MVIWLNERFRPHRLCQHAEVLPEHIPFQGAHHAAAAGKHHRTGEAHPTTTQDFAQRSG